MYVLGIDGGGTKTKGVIANSSGEIIAEATVGASNPNNVKKSDLEIEISTLFDSLRLQNRNVFDQVKRVYAGMSGVDHPAARKEMQKLIQSVLPSTVNVTVNNDAITALYSGTLGEPGIVQIAGTGSITFGLNEKGILDRVGGWGHLLGESGSGYAVGSDGLQAAFSAHDGLGERTELNNLILTHFQVQSLPAIIHTVYNSANPKELIASLSKLVVSAADSGDKVAQDIIRKNAFHIGEAISCLIKRLFTEKDSRTTIPVVLVGGLFNRLDLFEKPMKEVFRDQQIDVNLIKPRMEPVGGAVVAGLLEENIKISNGFPDIFCLKK